MKNLQCQFSEEPRGQSLTAINSNLSFYSHIRCLFPTHHFWMIPTGNKGEHLHSQLILWSGLFSAPNLSWWTQASTGCWIWVINCVQKWHLVRFRASLSKSCQTDPGKHQAGLWLPMSYGQQELHIQGQSFITKTRSKGGAKRKGS